MCILGGLVLSAVGAANFDDIYTLAHRSEVVTGTVVDKRTGLRGPTEIGIKFITRSGETVVADTWRVDHEPNIGDQIQVEYDPLEPTLIQGADWGHDYWLTLIFFGVAAVVVAGGVVSSFED
jgi:hypothetical protein